MANGQSRHTDSRAHNPHHNNDQHPAGQAARGGGQRRGQDGRGPAVRQLRGRIPQELLDDAGGGRGDQEHQHPRHLGRGGAGHGGLLGEGRQPRYSCQGLGLPSPNTGPLKGNSSTVSTDRDIWNWPLLQLSTRL